MKVPLRYQVFPTPVVLTDKDAQRLSPCLGYWSKLHILLKKPGFNASDLQRLVVLELINKQRKHIITRLLMRLGGVERKAVEDKIKAALR